MMPACVRAGDVIVGEFIGLARPRAPESTAQTEVENLDRAVRSQLDVGRLQIPVNDAGVVRGFKRLGDLAGNRDGFVNRDRSTAMRSARVSPGTSSMTSARVEAPSVAAVSSIPKIWAMMIQRRQGLRFAREAHHAVGIGREEVGEDLDRDLAVEPRVTGAILRPFHRRRACRRYRNARVWTQAPAFVRSLHELDRGVANIRANTPRIMVS